MPFHVYLLKCANGSYYAGHTDALEARLAQHRDGMGSDWTKRRLPVVLMWTDTAPTRVEALAFERRIKGWTRVKKEALIAGDRTLVSYLARPPRERPSTSLRTNGGGADRKQEASSNSVRPEPVEGRRETVEQRPSTSLRTKGVLPGKEGA